MLPASTNRVFPPLTVSTNAWARAWVGAIRRGLATWFGLVRLALWRIRYYSGLSLLALAGVTLAVGLVTSAGFFAQAVDQVMLNHELAEYTRLTQRPPFASRVFVASSAAVPLTLERAETLGHHVADTLAAEVGLPVRRVTLLADSGTFGLYPPPGDTRYGGERALGKAALVVMQGIGEQIDVIEGAPFDDNGQAVDLQVWMYQAMAAKLGLQVGDRFVLQTAPDSQLPITVAGTWSPRDPTSSFWLNDPNQTMTDKLLVRRADYLRHVEPFLPVKVRTANWQVTLDETAAIPARARDYKAGFERAALIIPRYLPDGRVAAPTLTLEKFVGQQTALTTLLLSFNVPALGFLLYFLALTSAVIAYWQRRETAVLRSRGISGPSILQYTLIETGLLFVIGAPLGLLLGLGLARGMGYTEGFLRFTPHTPLPVSWRGLNWQLTLGTLAVVMVVKLWPVATSARETIVTQTRDHARPTRGPFWYRAYLDLLLVIPTVYAYRQFVQHGSLASLIKDRPEDLYQDPLLVLVPGLFIITSALLAMRLFPLIMRLLDLAAGRVGWFSPYLALRQLGRQSHTYINPLILVIVSLGLGVYTLSMAASMDHWLADRVAHRVGADLTLMPGNPAVTFDAPSAATAGAEWVPPIDEFGALPGVTHAARVGDYLAVIRQPDGSGGVEGRFLAIDRLDFPLTAWFRADYAGESLGGLMNRLAVVPDGILVNREYLEANDLHIGDRLLLLVIPDFAVDVRAPFTIVGAYEYFPTVYGDKITVIGNMDNIINYFGIAMPHRIWFRLAAGATDEQVLAGARSTGIQTLDIMSTHELLNTAQAEFERVGVFGTLTVSFLAAALMAALGLLTYSYASLQERLFQFAVLRAVGLHRLEIIGQVTLEYAILTAYGAVAGVACGSVAAVLFVPLFRIAANAQLLLPPLVPIIAEEQTVPLAAGFAITMVVLELFIIATAFYRRVYASLRMGHQG